jgi:hypothetical protein
MMSSPFRAAAAGLLLGLAACVAITENPIHLSTDPPGAHVLVDGKDSGFVTPCMLDIERQDTEIAFRLDGYAVDERDLTPDARWTMIFWREMSLIPVVWRCPLWLNRNDVFTPFKLDRSLTPNRIHVRLRRAADLTAL